MLLEIAYDWNLCHIVGTKLKIALILCRDMHKTRFTTILSMASILNWVISNSRILKKSFLLPIESFPYSICLIELTLRHRRQEPLYELIIICNWIINLSCSSCYGWIRLVSDLTVMLEVKMREPTHCKLINSNSYWFWINQVFEQKSEIYI